MAAYKLYKNHWVMPFFVIFRCVRDILRVTVAFDHPVSSPNNNFLHCSQIFSYANVEYCYCLLLFLINNYERPQNNLFCSIATLYLFQEMYFRIQISRKTNRIPQRSILKVLNITLKCIESRNWHCNSVTLSV